jgi:hypothetical protein
LTRRHQSLDIANWDHFVKRQADMHRNPEMKLDLLEEQDVTIVDCLLVPRLSFDTLLCLLNVKPNNAYLDHVKWVSALWS